MRNPILISLFNHKGGVSKTTTTFNLGWTFANLGIKTLIVDTDPQCNLTAYVLGFQKNIDLEEFYSKKENEDLYSALKPILEGQNLQIKPIKPCETLNGNLKLIAGHLNLSDVDMQISLGLLGSGLAAFSKQFVGSLHTIIRETAKSTNCELVLIDMSPSSGAMNRSILMSSDYFIIPTSPDFFSHQAIQSLGDMFLDWERKMFKTFRDASSPNSFPQKPPKLIGIISQKYRTYTPKKKEFKEKIPFTGESSLKNRKKRIAKAYGEWIDKIQKSSDKNLAEKLKSENMVIDKDTFKSHINDELPYNLISVGDFNSLIAASQKYQKPVFELTDEEIDQTGLTLEEMKEKQKEFKDVFKNLALRISKLIKDDNTGKPFDKLLS